MASDQKKEPEKKPLIYHPTVDHGDLDRPVPTYGKTYGEDKGGKSK